jgi:hypothetical protein
MSDLRDAAELALTALENTCPNNWTSVKENLRKALAQPEPEPVAWGNKKGEFKVHQEADDAFKSTAIPFYTAPPKREWVGLTDEEIENLWEMAQAWNAPKHFYILIAAKLKEKNT